MDFYSIYTDYFRQIATNHTAICHDPAGKGAFFRIDIQEAILGRQRRRAQDGSHVLELISPKTRIDYNRQDGQSHYHHEGGFLILGHHKDGGDTSQEQAMDAAFRIADEILLMMSAHSRGGHPLWCRGFDREREVDIHFITYKGDGNWAGVRVMFAWQTPRNTCIHREDWKNDIEADLYFPEDEIPCLK